MYTQMYKQEMSMKKVCMYCPLSKNYYWCTHAHSPTHIHAYSHTHHTRTFTHTDARQYAGTTDLDFQVRIRIHMIIDTFISIYFHTYSFM